MAVLLAFFSFVLYNYISYSVGKELQASLLKQARYLFAKYDNLEQALKDQKYLLRKTLKIQAAITSAPKAHYRPMHFQTIHDGKRYYLRAFFPYNFRKQSYLILTADITQQKKMEQKVFRAIVSMNAIAMGLILLYAFFLSQMLTGPIRFFSRKLARMDENILEPLDLNKIPLEFRPLGHSINNLVTRIKSFLLYKKELFVGTAHELKTPLAVMKTRSQVTLIKKRRTEKDLEQVLRDNIGTIDDMNRIIGAILEFGRAEGAQFETPKSMELITFIRSKIDEFILLAEAEGKRIFFRLSPERINVKIQPLLLTQILQNLLQNALRFTPKGGTVRIFTYLNNDVFIIKIRDEGPGVDESVDLFAPFKRSRESSGAGLGLFLVKSASDALGGSVTVKNRSDGKGAVATFYLPLKQK